VISPKRVLLILLTVLTAFGSTVSAASAGTESSPRGSHLAVWAPSMTIGGPNFSNQTLRMVVHPSVGGAQLRVRLSNLRGTTPLAVGAVSIALQASHATAVSGSQRTVTFDHAKTFTIPTGSEVVSDPIPMSVRAEQNLLVSLYLPQATSSATYHSDAFDTSFLSKPGNYAGDVEDGNYITATTAWYYLSGLDVVSPKASGTVVAFGDSITDGYNTPNAAYRRWPDDLARRLAGDHPTAVVDAGLGGNRVLTDVPNIWQGISALKRFRHDALQQPGARAVILMEGINDIGNNAGPNGAPLTTQDLINGYRDLIGQAHSAGARIIGGTMLPNKGAGYYSESAERIRQAANAWIRTGGAFDGVVDFDLAMQNPADASALRPAYDSGDHLHPNATGMQAMADAVDLNLLKW
jgi:lysophospholipase L1-like esterase